MSHPSETLLRIVAKLPDVAQDQLLAAWSRESQPERIIEPRSGYDFERVRTALRELAGAIFCMDHHNALTKRTPECDSWDNPKTDENGEPEWRRACPHLLRLWAAREKYELACLNAPAEAVGCDCHGTGVFYGRGYIENGVFKGTTGKHYACNGKGWQSPEDVKRNRYYWNHIARI
jgi:hypothetical protein